MIFKKPINYSIVDPVQPRLDSDIVIGDKLNSELRKKILSAVSIISNKMHLKMVKIWIVGSSLTYQYVKNESDIDVTIFLEHKTPEELTELNKDVTSHFNEKLYYREHPINFHFVAGRFFKFKADAIYDLRADKWIKKPEAMSEEDLEELIRKCSSIKEFKEVLEEYTELKQLLEDYTGEEEELNKILSQSFKVSKLFTDIRDMRREDFKKGVDKSLPSANFRPSNVIFKLLEQYGLDDLTEEISHFLNTRFKDQRDGDRV